MIITLTADTAAKLAEWAKIVTDNAPLFLKYQDLYTLAAVIGYQVDGLLNVGWCPGYSKLDGRQHVKTLVVAEDQEPTILQLKQIAARHMLVAHGEIVQPESMEYEYSDGDAFLSWNTHKTNILCMSHQGQVFYVA